MSLYLKKFELNELPIYYNWMRDPLFCGEFVEPDLASLDELTTSFHESNGWASDEFTRFLLMLKEKNKDIPTDIPVGFLHFWKFDKYEQHLEFGLIIHPAFRGKGFGFESQKLLINYIFSSTKVNRIQAITTTENYGNLKCWKNLGITIEGTLRAFSTVNNKALDCYLGSILRSEWSEKN